MTEYNHTKAMIKKSVATLTYQGCIDRMAKVSKEILRSKYQVMLGQNPYQAPNKDNPSKIKLNPKMLRYEKSLLSQRLTNLTIKKR